MKKLTSPKVVLVKFDDDKEKNYAYLTDIKGVKKGDILLVGSPFGDNEGYGRHQMYGVKTDEGFVKAVRVVATKASAVDRRKASKWIIGKLDTSSVAERTEARKALAELTEELRDVKVAAQRQAEIEKLEGIAPGVGEIARKIEQLENQLGLTGAHAPTGNVSVFRG